MNIAVILASGDGTRLNYNNEKKCFIEVCNKPLFSYSLNTFFSHEEIDYIYLMVPNGFKEKALKNINNDKTIVLEGGSSRQESVFKALKAIKEKYVDTNPLILVHDGARPLISKQLISRHLVLHKVNKDLILYTSLKCHDSYVRQEGNKYLAHVERENLYIEQTPTSASLSNYLKAFEHVNSSSFNDDIALFAKSGFIMNSVEGENLNFKITDLDDLNLFKNIIK